MSHVFIHWWTRLVRGERDLHRVHIRDCRLLMVCGRIIPGACRMQGSVEEGWGRGIDAGWEEVKEPIPEDLCQRCQKIAGKNGNQP